MKILITGGAGFIGSNFVRMIVAKHPKDTIINMDNITYAGNLDNLKDVENKTNYKFIKCDICDNDTVSEAMEGVDLLFNFAAESHVDRSITDPHVFVKTNVLGTSVLLESARKHNVNKFIHVSTDEVYGSIQKGSFKETDKLNPSSAYSSSKASADLLALSYYYTFNFPVIITRTTNNFGPYQYPEKLISLFITNLLEGKKVPLYGDGKNIRDWIFVKDNCEAIEMISKKGKNGEIYNIGGENELMNIEIVGLILKEMGLDNSYIEYVKDRPGHDRRYSLDCTKIKKLGWSPKHKFSKALNETIEWYKNNEEWWKKLKK